jgi:Tn3 transposase DDE domain
LVRKTSTAPRLPGGVEQGRGLHTHAAADYSNRQDRFTDRSLENQEYRASGLNLLIAAISYWNTLYLDKAVQHLRSINAAFDPAFIAHLSPMGWAHISLTGGYLRDQAKRLPAREFRPFNVPTVEACGIGNFPLLSVKSVFGEQTLRCRHDARGQPGLFELSDRYDAPSAAGDLPERLATDADWRFSVVRRRPPCGAVCVASFCSGICLACSGCLAPRFQLPHS